MIMKRINASELRKIRKRKRFRWSACLFLIIILAACSGNPSLPDEQENDKEPVPAGSIPGTIIPDIEIEMRGTKICQLVGDYDKERNEPTENQTFSRYQLSATDLGVPFQDGDTTWIAFGDTWGIVGGDRDAIAYTTDKNPEDGLALNFVNENNQYYPVTIPGISQGAFEVPVEGLIVNSQMYIYHTTGHNSVKTMGRSVLARGDRVEGRGFSYLYTLSSLYFINVSIVQADAADWNLLPENQGKGLVIFGSGNYRESHVYLAFQPESGIENPETIRYFAGLDEKEQPLWDTDEKNALPVFPMSEPSVGELSVSYNPFIKRWILMYNCGNPRGINVRTAENPWGPWSNPQVIFHPWDDNGYCHFMHTSWTHDKCDAVHDTNRENVWGGEYGPYQFEHFATGDDTSTTIYFTLSTWNPYTVVLMKAGLRKK